MGSATAGDALRFSIDDLHTTALGAMRISKNLRLGAQDAVAFCQRAIARPDALIERRGKNFYIRACGCVITVNARSGTLITAHPDKAARPFPGAPSAGESERESDA